MQTQQTGRVRCPWAVLLTMAAALPSAVPPPVTPPADGAARRWTDDQLVASFRDLASSGGLEPAVRAPALPDGVPDPRFLEALAWWAAGAPDRPGELTLQTLDGRIQENVLSYLALLKAKAERGEDDDYARTRTWKLIQKLTLLRRQMSGASGGGAYRYPALTTARAAPGVDAWDRDHTLRSEAEFEDKVCRGSATRPVLVKFGNTNCTQCMLFEILGSVQEFAENPAHKGTVDVYKVWWGYRPDAGFAGRIRDPERLDALVKAEGVKSSPSFIVYRNGRARPCGDAFPDDRGEDDRLEACLRQDLSGAPQSSTCAAARPGRGGADSP